MSGSLSLTFSIRKDQKKPLDSLDWSYRHLEATTQLLGKQTWVSERPAIVLDHKQSLQCRLFCFLKTGAHHVGCTRNITH